MFTTKERVAVARIVSDMIKADNIIEESEIEMLNSFQKQYNINSQILSEARYLKFSQAVSDLCNLSDADKITLFKSIKGMAAADGLCVPKEAMLLLALRYALGVERDKVTKEYFINHDRDVKLISCPTGENAITSQYVIYIEGEHNQIINDNIRRDFEVNVLKLRQWGFDFIYIPSLIDEFRTMNVEYVKDVISFMAPELSKNTIDIVYERLLRMDTVTFCNHVLAEKLHVDEVKNAVPSLFVNIGTSVVPFKKSGGSVECYTEFLCIPLDQAVTLQISDFIRAYSKLVSFHFTPISISNGTNRFRYFGFYKAMFDFLVKAEPKDSDLVIHPWNNQLDFPQIDLPPLVLSPQEAALYKLILECTYNHQLQGLPTSLTPKEEESSGILDKYRKIYHKKEAELPFDLAPIRSRIAGKMQKHLGSLSNLNDYIPKLKDKKYVIDAPVSRIKICDTHVEGTRDFLGYEWK